MDEGTFAGWLKKDGEQVKPGEPLFTMESDKALQDVEALDGGILRIPPGSPQDRDTVTVGQLLGYLVDAGESPPAPAVSPRPAPASTALTEAKAAPPAAPAQGAGTPASPRARRTAAELDVNLAGVQGTGKGGRIRERDVRSSAPAPAAASPASPPAPAESRPMSALRRTIAERMVRSLANTAQVTLTCRADATNLVALRNQFKSAEGGAFVPTYTDIVAKLAAVALLKHPLLASRLEGDHIVPPSAIHIGIAVDTEQGLLVPVIRNVPDLSLKELARSSRELVEAARARRLKAEQLQGSVFTITNLGSFGVEAFTPIINFPETAILGLGAICRDAVVLDDGHIASREQFTLSLGFDHRVVDGAPAARFLQLLRQAIENPAAWLLAS
jgi:pyruvate dehydrogenase E2 component (dihydrolipoamide acetyltransferase)